MPGIWIVNDAIRANSGLPPSHVPPDGGNRCEVATRRIPWRRKRRSHGDLAKSATPVGRPIDEVRAVAEPAAPFVHGGDEHCTVRSTRELHVADEDGGDLHRRRPHNAIVRMRNVNELS